LALEHLCELGHEEIALLEDRTMSSDSVVRGMPSAEVARELDFAFVPELTIQLEGTAPRPGSAILRPNQLLARKHPFTALFAYKRYFGHCSLWAFREAGLRAVPEDLRLWLRTISRRGLR